MRDAHYTPRMRWASIVFVLLLAVPLTLLGPRGSVVAVKTALFIPEIFPDAPVKPLRWLTSASNVERTTLSYAGGLAHLETYVPAQPGPHGAVILMLGARPIDQDDPVVTRFADGLSRLGVVVLVPASDGLAAGRIAPAEVDLLVQEFQILRNRPDVDPQRVGYIGLSVGASLSLVAAADARIAANVAFVNAFGGYFDAQDLFVALASHSLAYAGESARWEPAPLTREVLLENLLDSVPIDTERDAIRHAVNFPGQTLETEIASLSPSAQVAVQLLSEPEPSEARRLVNLLAEPGKNQLEAISPRYIVHRLQANILVMHDIHDQYIPYTESRHLVAALPDKRLRAWTELELFDHVMPGRATDHLTFVRELAELSRHVYVTFLEML
ncbi:MAG: hypothetical protein ACKVVP_15700 [Chloroflexota bacterium]